MIHTLGKATLTFLVVVALHHPVRANPPLGRPNEMAARESQERLEQMRERAQQQVNQSLPEPKEASDLEDLVGRFVGFCDSFYGCGAGVRFMDW